MDEPSGTFDFASMNEKNQQTLTDIQNLQQIETELSKSLEQGIASGELSEEQKQILINRINEITQTRINLYKILNNVYSFVNQNISNSQNTTSDQGLAVNIVENELNRAKEKLSLLNQDKYNKMRMVEINTYYGKQYSAHTTFFKMTALVCVLGIILIKIKGIIPSFIFVGLTTCIIVGYIIITFYYLADMYKRSSNNYDEYNFPKPNGSPSDGASTGGDPWAQPSMATCVGNACCDTGFTYDPTLNKCKANVV